MSLEEVKRFNGAVKNSAEMQEEIKTLGNDVDKMIGYANEQGYTFTVDDINQLGQGNLSDEDLDKVAGGGGVVGVLVVEAVEVIGVVAVVS